jgi:hypothetical protein
MEMQDIRRLEIVAGPVLVAYDFDPKTGTFTVWLGHHTVGAPETDTIQRTEVPLGVTTWVIEDALEAA